MNPVRCRLVYDGAQSPEPVLYRIGRNPAVKVSLLSETICAGRGTVSVSFSGTQIDVESALARLRSAGIGVELHSA